MQIVTGGLCSTPLPSWLDKLDSEATGTDGAAVAGRDDDDGMSKLTCPFRMLSSLGGHRLSLLLVSIPSSSILILLNRF